MSFLKETTPIYQRNWDLHEKHHKYTQRINLVNYAKPDHLFSSEKEFIIASLLNHSDTALKLSTLIDIFAIKSTKSSFNTKAGKLQFLANIREKLKNLFYNSLELQKITIFINEQEKYQCSGNLAHNPNQLCS